ncbi:MAG: hypothetical protein AB7O62_15365 [Pirellulales bacterium]
MRRTGRAMSHLLCAALLLATNVGIANAQGDAAAADKSQPMAAQLVRQLGSSSYRERELATSELSKLGLAAKSALLEGLRDPDAEIRLRCQRVLVDVMEQDYQARLAAFAADKEGKSDHQLPGWDRFRGQIGEHPEARALFVEMLRADPATMEATESKPARAAEVLALRCQQVHESLYGQNFGERQPASTGTISALFFLAGNAEVASNDQTTMQLGNLGNQFQNQLTNGPKADMLRKLLGGWIARTDGSPAAFQAIQLALRFDLPEGLSPAIQACQKANGQTHLFMYAALAVGKFGNKDQVAVLEPMLENTNICLNYNINNEMHKAEVRDVALAVLLHLTGQDAKEYGFTRLEKNQMYLYNPTSLGFREKDERPGFDKWKAWSAEQKKAGKG